MSKALEKTMQSIVRTYGQISQLGTITWDNHFTNFIRDAGFNCAAFASGGVNQMAAVGGAYTAGSIAKIMTAFKLNDSQLVHRGGLFPTDTSCIMPVGLNSIRFGDRAAGDRTLNGWIGEAGIFTTRGTQADMQRFVA